MSPCPRLLCIDLQTGERAPEARAVFGARQLLSVARRCRWPVIHTRLRNDAMSGPGMDARHAAALRPLTSERVFLRNRRSSADCPALIDQLEQWSRDTVYLASFDPMALLALLIDRADRGPNFVLVDDALSHGASEQVLSAAHALAPRITIAALIDAVSMQPARGAPELRAAP